MAGKVWAGVSLLFGGSRETAKYGLAPKECFSWDAQKGQLSAWFGARFGLKAGCSNPNPNQLGAFLLVR